MVADKNVKVLIVEDDENICEMYSTAFKREGYKVYTASEGRSALTKYEKKEPDIVLLDIMMPHTDGYEVLKEIRKRFDKYVPVIMLTNLNVSHFTKHESLDRVDGYLVKSNHTPSEVVKTTIDVLNRSKKK